MNSGITRIQFAGWAMELCGAMQMPGSIEGHAAKPHLNDVVHAGVVNIGHHRFLINYANEHPILPAKISVTRLHQDERENLEENVNNLIFYNKLTDKGKELYDIWKFS